MKTTFLTFGWPRRLTRSLPLLGALIFPAGFNLRADAPPTTLHLAPAGVDVEGLPQYQLTWNAVSNATYVVQSATDLMATDGWKTVEVVTPTSGLGQATVRLTHSDQFVPDGINSSASFYRLILPQPELFSVEPAMFAPGVAVDAYVIGQCFETNDMIRVDGVPVPAMLHLNPNQFHGPLPALSVGRHLVELVRDGVVKSSFTVMCADAMTNPELVLQGPPEEPPAAPRRPVGRITFKAKEGATLARGLTDKIRENDNVVFEVVEGKKGLNAVNVSRARRGWKTFRSGGVVLHETLGTRLSGGLGTDGVNGFSGEVQMCDVDLVIPGRSLDFVWARTYRARPGNQGVINFALTRWTHSYDVAVAQTTAGIAVADGTGRLDTFKLQANGTYTCSEFFREGTISNNTFTLTFADTGRWVFQPFDGSPVAGKLREIITRNGDTMTLGYDTSGRLSEVVDDLGRTNTVGYGSDGRLASVTDFSGRTVTYQYYQGLPGEPGGAGDLKSVTSPPVTGTPNGNDFPGGKTNSYTYSSGYLDDRENHLLLTARDANGTITHSYIYQHNQTSLDFLRCISVQRWTNAPTTFSYLPQTPTPANQFATLRCIINDPVGNVTEYFSDARNRCVKLQEFTGRAAPGVPVTDTVNRPTGKLRSSDPDYYETQWTWNNDSLLRKLKVKREYSGDKTVSTWYASDFDPATPARKRADCRVVREIASSPVDVDGDGAADLAERTWRYEYDPRFGSDAMGSPVMRLIDIARERAGDPFASSAAKAKGIVSVKSPSGTGARLGSAFKDNPEAYICPSSTDLGGDGFVIFATDPRGNVATAEYDEYGNQRKQATIASNGGTGVEVRASFSRHNARGQLTATTNAPDATGFTRVDTFDYHTNGPQQGYLKSCVVDAGGLALTESYEYDARGNLTRFVDPRGHDTLYTYNALDQLVRYQTPTNLTARTATDFTYDAKDNLVRVETERRDENDLIILSLPTKGVLYQHDALNRCTEIVRQVSANNFITNRFSYDANDNVVAVHSPLAASGADLHAITQLAHDERGLAFRTTAAPGSTLQSTTQWDYDANGNVTRVSEGLEGTPRITTLEYDGFAGFHDQILKKVLGTYTLIGSGLRLSGSSPLQIAAAGTLNQKADLAHGGNCGEHAYSLQFEHGDINRPIVLGSVWGMKNAMQGITGQHISKITDPNGNVATFNYDANDNLKVARHFGQLNDTIGTNGNLRLAESRWKYDGLDRCVEASTALFNPATQAPIGDGASVTTFAYAPNGQCTNVTDDLGRATTLAYDTTGRHISTTSAGAKTVTAVFRDAAGNVTRSTQTDTSDLGGPPQAFSRTNIYDSLNRLVSTTDNTGNTENWHFDSASRVVRATDAKGNVSWASYDDLSRQTFAIADLNGDGLQDVVVDVNTSWAYDANSRLTSTTDDNTNTTSYAYDSLGRQVLATSPDGTAHAFVWNPVSDLVREQDPNGTVITNSYDLLGRCVRRDITPGAGVATTTTFETFAYDGLSQLVAATNDVSHSEFEYDSLGNCIGNHTDGWNVLSDYDSVGNRVALTYPSGRIVTYAYDALDQVTNVSSSASAMTLPTSLAQFAYAGPGRETRITRANGTRTDITWNGLVSPPNLPGDFGRWQQSGIGHTLVVSGAVIDQRQFTFDRNQNKIMRAQTAPFFVGGDTTTNLFAYDALDRLHQTETTLGVSFKQVAYALDGNGNRQLVVSNGVAMPYFMDNTPLPGPADFQMDQYTMTPFGSQNYDANGNLTARITTLPAKGVLYQYDCHDRLVAVQSESDEAGTGVPVITPVASYSYDALGRRISRTVYPPAPALPVTTEYLHGPGGGSILETRQFGALIDSLISKSEDGLTMIRLPNGGGAQYYHTDDLGNVLALTDDTGTVLERYDYDDFGLPSFLTSDGLPTSAGSSAYGNSFLFHGMEWEPETGLYFSAHENPLYEGSAAAINPLFGSQYLDPQTGRAVRGKVKSIRDLGNGRAHNGNNPWSAGKAGRKMLSMLDYSVHIQNAIEVQFNPKEIGIDKSATWTKPARSRIPAGFVTKKTFGQLAGKK